MSDASKPSATRSGAAPEPQPAAPTSPFDLVVTRVFDAAPAAVWSAWTNADHVKQWWAPTGFTCPLADMDVRVGGVSLVCMRAPEQFGGMDFYNTWTYTSVIPHERLEFLAHFSDKDRNKLQPAALGLPPDLPFEVRQIVTFKPLEGDRTEMTVTELGYTTEPTRELSKAGLNQCLDKMAASFAKS